jgi:hypothetical protein
MDQKAQSAMKGGALYIATILGSTGIAVINTDKWFGLICLVLSASIFFAREYLLKK